MLHVRRSVGSIVINLYKLVASCCMLGDLWGSIVINLYKLVASCCMLGDLWGSIVINL